MAVNETQLIAHLLRRAGFGATEADLQGYVALGYQATLEQLLNPANIDDGTVDQLVAGAAPQLTPEDKIADGAGLWFLRMLYSKRPLVEKMSLFWHNHFATAFGKVKDPAMMYAQNQLFRDKGLGRFDDLLLGVAKDPAMIIWLDNKTNRKSHPNENWGRELMELFTIGIGNYTEQDVQEVARSFTGWSLDDQGAFKFNAAQHDSGSKTVLGQTGNFDGGDVLTILAGRRETGVFLATKMWRWFVNDKPDSAGVQQLADVYMSSNHDISAMLRAIFSGPDFQSQDNFFTTSKNPPEYICGVVKATGAADSLQAAPDAATLRKLAQLSASMGMQLYVAPNVGGWNIGHGWVTPNAFFNRANFVETLVLGNTTQPNNLLPASATTSATKVDGLLELMFHGPIPDNMRQPLINYADQNRTLTAAGLVRLIASTPVYQMN